MELRVLGCSGGIGESRKTTSFMVDGEVLIDAGSGVGSLTLDEMARVKHIFLTHSHLDHVHAIPLLVDSIFDHINEPIIVHGLPETIHALQSHIFNWVIWPDFSRLPHPDSPVLAFEPTAGRALPDWRERLRDGSRAPYRADRRLSGHLTHGYLRLQCREGHHLDRVGPPEILMEAGSLLFPVSPDSFFQVNSLLGRELQELVRSLPRTVRRKLLDLYCRVGFFTMALSGMAGEALGIERDQGAVRNAAAAARLNGLSNVKFRRGNAARACCTWHSGERTC